MRVEENALRIFVMSLAAFGDCTKRHADGFDLRSVPDETTSALDWCAIPGTGLEASGDSTYSSKERKVCYSRCYLVLENCTLVLADH